MPNAPFQFTVVVTNTGKVESDNVVLGFITNQPNGLLKELFGYERVHLKPGENTTVYFTVPPQVLSTVDEEGNEDILPGIYHLTMGDPLQCVNAILKVTGEKKNIFSLKKIKEEYQMKNDILTF